MGAASSVETADPTSSFAKCQGDTAFRAGQFHDAVAWYTQCILQEQSKSTKQKSEELAKLYSNRSAAYTGAGNYVLALDDALKAIDLHPTWTKAYFRASNASMHLGEGGKVNAREFLSKALALAPTDPTLLELQRNLFSNFQPHEHGIGEVYSWGRGEEGQLGQRGKTRLSLPTMLDGMRGIHVVEVAAGAMHTLALAVDGNVYTWGDNTYGQGGIVDRNTIEQPQLIPALVGKRVIAIACGAGHSIAVLSYGRVFSWGIGKQGQLGHQDFTENILQPREINAFDNLIITSASCGIAHSVFVSSEQAMYACGLNSFGQLGLGHANAIVQIPTKVESLPPVLHVACGGGHTCVVDETGRIWSTGSNSCGQLGLGHSVDVKKFTLVPMANPSALVVCGEEFSGAITTTRQVFMWGLGIAGQMGDGEYASYDEPKVVEGLPPIESLSLSQAQVFAITSEGGVWTWGLPGDRAHDASAVIRKPEQVASFFGKKRVRQLCCGRKHYVMVIMAPYGPSCSLKFTKSAPFVVGKWFSFKIQARDIDGEDCQVGGSKFLGVLKLIETTEPETALGLTSADSEVEINDDMNGTYSGRCRAAVAGKYQLQVTLNSLHVEDDNADLVELQPGPIFPRHCNVVWAKPPQVVPPGLELEFQINLRDKFHNLIGLSEEDHSDIFVVVQIVDKSNNSIVFKNSFELFAPITITSPQALGDYDLQIGIDGLNQDAAVAGSPFDMQVHTPIDLNSLASKASVIYPSESAAGSLIDIAVTWTEDIPIRGHSIRCELAPEDHSLSARALVRCGHKLHSVTEQVDKNGRCRFQPQVATKYNLTVTLEFCAQIACLHQGTIIVVASHPHIDFTEIIDGKSKFLEYQHTTTPLDIIVQLRDCFGNAINFDFPDHRISAMLSSSQSHQTSPDCVLQVGNTNVPGQCKIKIPPKADEGEACYLHVLLEGSPIMYSPFHLTEGSQHPDTPPQLLPSPGYIPVPLEPEKMKQLMREEITRRRADEALRRERMRLQAEREHKLKQNSMKRTGGGFTLQFN